MVLLRRFAQISILLFSAVLMSSISAGVDFTVDDTAEWESGRQNYTWDVDGNLQLRSQDLDLAYIEGNSPMFLDPSSNKIETGATALSLGGYADFDDDGLSEVAFASLFEELRYTDKNIDSVNPGIEARGAGGTGDVDSDGDPEVAYRGTSDNLLYTDTEDEIVNLSVQVNSTVNNNRGGVGGIADFDSDGNQDILYLNENYSISYTDSAGTVSNLGIQAKQIGGLGDFDSDSSPEVAYKGESGYLLYTDAAKNTGNTSVELPSGSYRVVGGINDFDKDGNQDIAYVSQEGELELTSISGETINTGISADSAGWMADFDNDSVSTQSGNYTSKERFSTTKVSWKNITVSGLSRPSTSSVDIWVKTSNDNFSTALENTKISNSQLDSGEGNYALNFSENAKSVKFNISMNGEVSPSIDRISINGVGSPNRPKVNSPNDGARGLDNSTTLNSTLTDPNGDDMNATFYWANGTKIKKIESVPHNESAEATVEGLQWGKTYEWYVEAVDGSLTTTSKIWNFTTQFPPSIQSKELYINQTSSEEELKLGLDSKGESDIVGYAGLDNVHKFTNESLRASIGTPFSKRVNVSDSYSAVSKNLDFDIQTSETELRQSSTDSKLSEQYLNKTHTITNNASFRVNYSVELDITGELNGPDSWTGEIPSRSSESNTIESSGDWISQDQFRFNVPGDIVLTDSYTGTRKLQVNEQKGIHWSNVSTEDFVTSPSTCIQDNQTDISLSPGVTENRTVGFACDPGSVDSQSFDLVNKTGYERAWNNLSFSVSSNLTEESNLTIPVSEDNLDKFSDRDGGSLESYVNGRGENISVRDGNGTVYITVLDTFGNSSLHEGTHEASLTYTVGDSDGSSPGGIGRENDEESNETNHSIQFSSQEYYTVAPGSSSRIYFTVWNYEKEANTVSIETRDTQACSYFSLQRNFVGDEFSKNTSLNIPGTRQDLGAGGADVILMAKVNLPNRTELQSQGLGDTFTCRFDTGAGIGEAQPLNLTVQAVDTTPRWVKGVRQLIPDLPTTSLIYREEICLPQGGEDISRLQQVQRYLEEGQCSGSLHSIPLPTGEASALIFGAFVFAAGIRSYRGRVI